MALHNATKGLLIIFVGPSGSGKDTLLKALQDDYAQDSHILFAKRIITRPSSLETEDFISVTQEEFKSLDEQGKFSVTWQAHGLHYGVPRTVFDHIEKGGIAFLNGARRALSNVVAVFPESKIIQIQVEKEVLAVRLMKRGREQKDDIEKRLAEASTKIDEVYKPIVVDNSDSLEKALLDMRSSVKKIIKEHQEKRQQHDN